MCRYFSSLWRKIFRLWGSGPLFFQVGTLGFAVIPPSFRSAILLLFKALSHTPVSTQVPLQARRCSLDRECRAEHRTRQEQPLRPGSGSLAAGCGPRLWFCLVPLPGQARHVLWDALHATSRPRQGGSH